MENKEGKRVSLEEFIRNNEQLLTAFGVFGALVALSKNIPGELSSFILSFAFVAGLILIWFELWYKLPKQDRMAPRLVLFRLVLLSTGTGLLFYWLIQFRTFWNAFLFLPITGLVGAFILGFLLPVVRSYKVTRAIFGIGNDNKNPLQKLARGITIFFFSLICLDIGVYIAMGTNLLFNWIKALGW